MSSFKTKTIALMASSLIVAVAGLSFATTPAFAKAKKSSGNYYASNKTQTNKPGKWHPNYVNKPSSAQKATKPGFANGGVPNK